MHRRYFKEIPLWTEQFAEFMTAKMCVPNGFSIVPNRVEREARLVWIRNVTFAFSDGTLHKSS